MRKSVLIAVMFGTALSVSSTMAVAAKKADPAVAANRNSAHFVHDALDPYCATKGKGCQHRHHWGWHHHHHHWGWGWGWHQHRHAHHHRHHKKKK
jgi:hypothetical protein